jgi:hypothetical protein
MVALDCAVPDAQKLQESLALAREHEMEVAAAKKRMKDLYATQYIDDFNDITEVTKVAAAKKKELAHIEIINREVAKARGEDPDAATKSEEGDGEVNASTAMTSPPTELHLKIEAAAAKGKSSSPKRSKLGTIYTPSNSDSESDDNSQSGSGSEVRRRKERNGEFSPTAPSVLI